MPEINYELLKEMIDCVSRELSLRYSVYPRLIESGKMTEEKAEREKYLMNLVKKSLQKIYDGRVSTEIQQALFDTEIYKKKERNFY